MHVTLNVVYLFSNVELELIYHIQLVSQHYIVTIDFKSSNRNAIGVSKCGEHRNYCILINFSYICLGIVIDLCGTSFLDIDSSNTDSDLLDRDIDSFSVNIFLISKTS